MTERNECEICARPQATRRWVCDECRQIAGQPLGEAAQLIAVAGSVCVVLIVGATVWQYAVAPLGATLPMLGWAIAGVLYALGGVMTGCVAVEDGEPFNARLVVDCAMWPVFVPILIGMTVWRILRK